MKGAVKLDHESYTIRAIFNTCRALTSRKCNKGSHLRWIYTKKTPILEGNPQQSDDPLRASGDSGEEELYFNKEKSPAEPASGKNRHLSIKLGLREKRKDQKKESVGRQVVQEYGWVDSRGNIEDQTKTVFLQITPVW